MNDKSIDRKILENLRNHLHQMREQEQGSLIAKRDEPIQHGACIEVLPISPHRLHSPMMTVIQENKSENILKQAMIPIIGNIVPQVESIEQTNFSILTKNTKELSRELQEMQHSFKMLFESTPIASNVVDTKTRPVSSKCVGYFQYN